MRKATGWQILLGAAFAGALSVLPAGAADYPRQNVRIIVPFAAGGSIDFIARVGAKGLAEETGGSFTVENRVGASGKIGVVAAKQAPPDGYTLLLATSLTHGINPALIDDVGYDAVKDFAPAVLLGSNQINVFVRSDLPAKSINELVGLMRDKPGALNYGTGGSGSANQMMATVLLAQAKLPFTAAVAVPYTGEAPAFADMLGGRVQFMITSGNKSHVDSGALRVLATTGRKRSLVYPDAPTMTELGFDDVYYAGWYGLEAPLGTPKSILDTINAAAAKYLARDDVKKLLAEGGFEASGGSIDSFQKVISDDAMHWMRVVKQYNLK
jgi:tripartite-type tricarboxylate transporter receptor subunit TctC